MAGLPSLLLLLLLAAISSADGDAGSRSAPPPTGCSLELVAMSVCLPHVAPPVGEATQEPSPSCCETFFSALDGTGGGPACLCHLVREPSLLGFPLNASRVASLFSSCGGSSPTAAASFIDFCRESKALPPLHDQTPPGDEQRRKRRSPPVPHVRPPPPPHGHQHDPPPSPLDDHPATWELFSPPGPHASPILRSGGRQSPAAPVLFLLPILAFVCL